jgi:NAD-dependent dihydropyrimidine dehydrogenase PreA subunit
MPFIITDPCIETKDTACVDVCPVDCIHPRKDEAEFAQAAMLYIHPEECIDCGACEPACPVIAIFEESAVPDQWNEYTKINADFFK